MSAKSPVTAVGHLIHELANKRALETIEQHSQWYRNGGTAPDPDEAVKRYNRAYEYHTQYLLCDYGLITRKEFERWRNTNDDDEG